MQRHSTKTDLSYQSTRSSGTSEKIRDPTAREGKKRLKINEKKTKKRKNEIENRNNEEPEDLHDQLRSTQKPGVIFPNDPGSSEGLTPGLEAIGS